MSLTCRKKIISWIGVIGILIQVYRWAFTDFEYHWGELVVAAFFVLLAIDLKALVSSIKRLIPSRNNTPKQE